MDLSVDQIIRKILEITTTIEDNGSQSDRRVTTPIYRATCEYFRGVRGNNVKQLDFYNKVVMLEDELMEYHGKFQMEYMEIHDLITKIGKSYDIFNQPGKRKLHDMNCRIGKCITDDRQCELRSLLTKLRAA